MNIAYVIIKIKYQMGNKLMKKMQKQKELENNIKGSKSAKTPKIKNRPSFSDKDFIEDGKNNPNTISTEYRANISLNDHIFNDENKQGILGLKFFLYKNQCFNFSNSESII